MAKVQSDPQPEQPASELAEGQPTPAPEDTGDKDGIHLAKPRKETVDDYPERPYRDAITDPQRELLRQSGQEPA